MLHQSSQILQTTWSAVEAAVSVILILAYGYAARKWGMLSQAGESNASHVSVALFLPCLLFSEIGPLASWSNLKEYWIIVVYSLLFQLCSLIIGVLGVRLFRMPQWIVPCMVFNNATSLPLLLLSSLGANGTLAPLVGENDSLDNLLSRGRVYLLINALTCNLTRFTFGPYLLKSHPIHMPHPWSHSESPHVVHVEAKVAPMIPTESPVQGDPTSYPQLNLYPQEAESAPLIHKANVRGRRSWRAIEIVYGKVSGLFNPPLVGGTLAIVAGIIPVLRQTLFSQDAVLSPFAQSISKLGNLYTVLQMFVLGAHLKSKRGSRPPLFPLIYLFVFRFAVMPIISNGVVCVIRRVVGHAILSDPVLDFTMAIAPVGPPALTLAAIVEMSDADESTETAVAQTIVLSYMLTPLISFSVTAALTVVGKLYR